MNILEKHGPFVNELIGFQEKMAAKFATTPWRQTMHLSSAEKLRGLLEDMKVIQGRIGELEARPLAPVSTNQRLTLTLEDIEGLPQELIQELSISEADRSEFAIQTLINEGGGVLSLDQILVGIFKKTGEINKRAAITSRLYRMAQKGLVFGVPNKKGVYSSRELTEEEAEKLFS